MNISDDRRINIEHGWNEIWFGNTQVIVEKYVSEKFVQHKAYVDFSENEPGRLPTIPRRH